MHVGTTYTRLLGKTAPLLKGVVQLGIRIYQLAPRHNQLKPLRHPRLPAKTHRYVNTTCIVCLCG
jgi:hypothetical protein